MTANLETVFVETNVDINKLVKRVLNSITPKEAAAIKQRYHCFKKKDDLSYIYIRSYAELSEINGFSEQWNKEKVETGIRKLQHLSRARQVKEFVKDMAHFCKKNEISYIEMYNFLRTKYTWEMVMIGVINGMDLRNYFHMKESGFIN